MKYLLFARIGYFTLTSSCTTPAHVFGGEWRLLGTNELPYSGTIKIDNNNNVTGTIKKTGEISGKGQLINSNWIQKFQGRDEQLLTQNIERFGVRSPIFSDNVYSVTLHSIDGKEGNSNLNFFMFTAGSKTYFTIESELNWIFEKQ